MRRCAHGTVLAGERSVDVDLLNQPVRWRTRDRIQPRWTRGSSRPLLQRTSLNALTATLDEDGMEIK
jgi:hypothetical protein